MDSAAFLLMAFDCSCQPGPWHCVLAGSVRFVSRLVLTPVPGEGWAEGKPRCAGTHPCPALPHSRQGGQGWPAHGECVAPGRHSWHGGHSAHGAKPSSWCRWCLAAFSLMQVAQALWHSNQTVVLSHPVLSQYPTKWGYLGAFWVLLHLGIFGGFLGALPAVTLVPGSCGVSPPRAAWLPMPMPISRAAFLPVVLPSQPAARCAPSPHIKQPSAYLCSWGKNGAPGDGSKSGRALLLSSPPHALQRLQEEG